MEADPNKYNPLASKEFVALKKKMINLKNSYTTEK